MFQYIMFDLDPLLLVKTISILQLSFHTNSWKKLEELKTLRLVIIDNNLIVWEVVQKNLDQVYLTFLS